MSASPWVRLVNNWLHDIASGTWVGCVLVLYMLSGEAAKLSDSIAASAIGRAMWPLWWLLLGALVVIAATGAARLAYWRASTTAEEMPAKRPALIGKHVAYLAVFGLGTAWAFFLLPKGL
jgi:hypothetical protein